LLVQLAGAGKTLPAFPRDEHSSSVPQVILVGTHNGSPLDAGDTDVERHVLSAELPRVKDRVGEPDRDRAAGRQRVATDVVVCVSTAAWPNFSPGSAAMLASQYVNRLNTIAPTSESSSSHVRSEIVAHTAE
jgi:hypothetical protein